MKTRPSTFKPDYVRQARALYARGFTDRELAEALGVARMTIFRWCTAYPEFAEARRAGKSAAGDQVTVRITLPRTMMPGTRVTVHLVPAARP
jgi:uncharacterized protein YjcR